jgi:hypothetical protein
MFCFLHFTEIQNEVTLETMKNFINLVRFQEDYLIHESEATASLRRMLWGRTVKAPRFLNTALDCSG